jgi:hypothetical protein
VSTTACHRNRLAAQEVQSDVIKAQFTRNALTIAQFRRLRTGSSHQLVSLLQSHSDLRPIVDLRAQCWFALPFGSRAIICLTVGKTSQPDKTKALSAGLEYRHGALRSCRLTSFPYSQANDRTRSEGQGEPALGAQIDDRTEVRVGLQQRHQLVRASSAQPTKLGDGKGISGELCLDDVRLDLLSCETVTVTCRCGHTGTLPVAALMSRHGRAAKLRDAVAQARCTRCGKSEIARIAENRAESSYSP